MAQFSIEDHPVISAGPTSGKTSLVGALIQDGWRVFDTDYLCQDGGPFEKWLSLRLFSLQSTPLKEFASLMKDEATGVFVRALLKEKDTIIVTNLGSAFFYAAGVKMTMPYFFRENPSEIVKLASSRGSAGIDESLARKWVESARKHGGTNVHWLKDGEYLSEKFGYSPVSYDAVKEAKYWQSLYRTYKWVGSFKNKFK